MEVSSRPALQPSALSACPKDVSAQSARGRGEREASKVAPCNKDNRPKSSTAEEFALAEPKRFTSLVLDLGDVLAFYSGRGLDLPIDSYLTRQILTSTTWAELECDRLARDECFARLSREFDVDASDIHETLRLLAGTLTFNTELIDTIRYLKRAMDGHLKVYLATNVTAADWELLRPTVESWDIFDHIFTSFAANARKPDRRYYRHLIDAGIDPKTTLIIDDKAENLITAKVVGMSCIQFLDTDQTITELKNAFGDPVARGEAWLRAHAKNMWSETNTGVVIYENFAQLMMLENGVDRDLLVLNNPNQKWNFFTDKPFLITGKFPDDLDTTTLAFRSVPEISSEVKHSVMDEMLEYVNEDGLFNTYFDHKRPRYDIHITSNILRGFYSHGRGHQVQPTLKYMCEILRSRAYEKATHYYLHPDWLFYHLSAMCAACDDQTELADLRGLLRDRLAERFGSVEFQDSWSVAMRLVAAENLGLESPRDLETLRNAQQADGSWGKDPWIYRYGFGVLIGHVGLVTAVALRVLRTAAQKKY